MMLLRNNTVNKIDTGRCHFHKKYLIYVLSDFESRNGMNRIMHVFLSRNTESVDHLYLQYAAKFYTALKQSSSPAFVAVDFRKSILG